MCDNEKFYVNFPVHYKVAHKSNSLVKLVLECEEILRADDKDKSADEKRKAKNEKKKLQNALLNSSIYKHNKRVLANRKGELPTIISLLIDHTT